MIRVVIADDQQLIRAGFRALLQAESDIEVVGEAATGATLWHASGSIARMSH